jgi:ketosteroid isomerase-like protein
MIKQALLIAAFSLGVLAPATAAPLDATPTDITPAETSLPPNDQAYSRAEQDNIEAANQLIDAISSGDVSAVKALLASNVVWEVRGSSATVPMQGSWTGTDMLDDWVENNEPLWESINLGSPEAFADGQQVILLGQTAEYEPAGITDVLHDSDNDGIADADEMDVVTPVALGKCGQPWVAILTFSGGKVSQFKVFDNSAATYWALKQ